MQERGLQCEEESRGCRKNAGREFEVLNHLSSVENFAGFIATVWT